MFIGSNLWKIHNPEAGEQANNDNDNNISILSNYIYTKLEKNFF